MKSQREDIQETYIKLESFHPAQLQHVRFECLQQPKGDILFFTVKPQLFFYLEGETSVNIQCLPREKGKIKLRLGNLSPKLQERLQLLNDCLKEKAAEQFTGNWYPFVTEEGQLKLKIATLPITGRFNMDIDQFTGPLYPEFALEQLQERQSKAKFAFSIAHGYCHGGNDQLGLICKLEKIVFGSALHNPRSKIPI